MSKLTSQQRWAAKNPEKVKEACRRWRMANRDKAKKASRRWAARNRERNKETQRRWRQANRQKVNDYQRKWAIKNPEKSRAIDLRRFGITLQQFNTLNTAQTGKCAICKGLPTGKAKRLSVDHCHATGKVRGLLCSACNHLLGHAKDNSEILQKAIQYLNRYNL